MTPTVRGIGDLHAVRALRGDPDDTTDGPFAQMGLQERHQILWPVRQAVPSEKAAIVGQDRVDVCKIACGGYLGIFEGQAFVTQRSGKNLLR